MVITVSKYTEVIIHIDRQRTDKGGLTGLDSTNSIGQIIKFGAIHGQLFALRLTLSISESTDLDQQMRDRALWGHK